MNHDNHFVFHCPRVSRFWSTFRRHPGRMSEDKVVLGGFDRAQSRLALVKHLVLAACGTSLYASMYGAKLMRDLEALDTATVRWCWHPLIW